jgi:NAD(P)-dependent dehydrogenase (short-subunit alcohol dehydrogenase family)
MPVTLITGTSSGLGLASALHFARAGHRVYAGLRNPARGERLMEAIAAEKLPIEIVPIDVTDAMSVQQGVAQVLRAEGRIDVLVNNAGSSGAAPLEETPIEEHRQMFETNYWGAIQMMLAVLPTMREQQSGVIVNISSITGVVCVPNQVPYSASKHALEAASEALANEVFSQGIRVRIVEPGVFATDIWTNSAEATRYDRNSPYKQVMRRNGKMYAALLAEANPAELAAAVIFEVATADDVPLRTLVGPDAEKMAAGRAGMSDEEWVALGADMSDDEYRSRFEAATGIVVK